MLPGKKQLALGHFVNSFFVSIPELPGVLVDFACALSVLKPKRMRSGGYSDNMMIKKFSNNFLPFLQK